MARARNIKPGFFKNEILAEMPVEARLLFIGLWTLADREGRLEDRPKKIKIEILVYDDFDVDSLLDILVGGDFILRYEVGGKKYIQINNFTKHQTPHHKEIASDIPAPPGYEQITKHTYDVPDDIRVSVLSRDGDRCLRCGSPNNLSIDHITPLAKGGDNSTNNLQTLCKSCNSSKGATTKDYRKINVSLSNNQQKPNIDATLNQSRSYVDASCPADSLIPDSLIPDSKDTDITHTVHDSQQSREPTPEARVCLAIKNIGIVEVNPSHPELLMLIEAGATIDEFMHAARTAKDKGKGFAYVLGVVKGQRSEALKAKDKVLKGKIPNKADALLQSNINAVSDWKPPEMRAGNDGT